MSWLRNMTKEYKFLRLIMKKRKITVKKVNVKECLQRANRNRDNFLSIYNAVKQLVDNVKYCHYPYPKFL